MKKLLSVLAVLSLLGLTACGSESDSIKIGLNYELSGGVANYGQAISKGVNLALEEADLVKGKQLEIIEYDNKSEQAEVVSLYTKLATQDQVALVLGPATSGNTKASVPLSTQYGVPVLSCSATDDKALIDAKQNVAANAFKTCFNDSYQGGVMANYAINTLGLKKAVILGDSSSDYAKGLAGAFKTKYKELGGVVIAEESYVEKDKDFNSVITKIKQLDFDCLFVPGYYGEVGLIIKQFREAGLTQPILGGDGFESDVLVELAGKENLNNVFYSNHYSTVSPSSEMKAFQDAFKEKYGHEPNTFSALGYDLGKFAIDVLNRAASTDSKDILDAINSTKDFKGVTGSFTMGSDHAPIKGCFIVELENGVAVKAEQINA